MIILSLYFIILTSILYQVTTRAGLLFSVFIPGTPAGVVWVVFGYIIARLSAHLRGFVSYPYIISFEYKNAFIRRLKGFKDYIAPRDHARPGTKTPAANRCILSR